MMRRDQARMNELERQKSEAMRLQKLSEEENAPYLHQVEELTLKLQTEKDKYQKVFYELQNEREKIKVISEELTWTESEKNRRPVSVPSETLKHIEESKQPVE